MIVATEKFCYKGKWPFWASVLYPFQGILSTMFRKQQRRYSYSNAGLKLLVEEFLNLFKRRVNSSSPAFSIFAQEHFLSPIHQVFHTFLVFMFEDCFSYMALYTSICTQNWSLREGRMASLFEVHDRHIYIAT